VSEVGACGGEVEGTARKPQATRHNVRDNIILLYYLVATSLVNYRDRRTVNSEPVRSEQIGKREVGVCKTIDETRINLH
jgi:hypothetical protein